MIQIVLLVKLVSPVCMIYHCSEKSISTRISVPGGCGSPRLRTGKGTQTPDPKENHKPSWPLRNWSGDASFASASGGRAVRRSTERGSQLGLVTVGGSEPWPWPSLLSFGSICFRSGGRNLRGSRPRLKPKRWELSAVLTRCCASRHNRY